MEYRSVAISSLLALGVGLSTSASAAVVDSFAPYTGSPTAGVWYESAVLAGGTASIVSLAGQGGNLENNQPLATGAARLTTVFDNASKAEVGVVDAYGNARDLFEDDFRLEYSYYKESVGNLFAAPSIKLEIAATNFGCYFSDCSGSLIYEPSWNQTPPTTLGQPPSVAVPLESWETVEITADSGLFWWNGGFGQSSSAAGPPMYTLNDWMALFNGNFEDANLVSVSMGVGTYNQGQDTYFDDVKISSNGYSASYDFEPVSEVPVPSTLLLMALGVLAGVSARKRGCKS